MSERSSSRDETYIPPTPENVKPKGSADNASEMAVGGEYERKALHTAPDADAARPEQTTLDTPMPARTVDRGGAVATDVGHTDSALGTGIGYAGEGGASYGTQGATGTPTTLEQGSENEKEGDVTVTGNAAHDASMSQDQLQRQPEQQHEAQQPGGGGGHGNNRPPETKSAAASRNDEHPADNKPKPPGSTPAPNAPASTAATTGARTESRETADAAKTQPQQTATEQAGKVQNAAMDVKNQAQDRAAEMKDQAQNKATDVKNQAQDKVTEMKSQAQDAAGEKTAQAQDVVAEKRDQVQASFADVKTQAQGKVQDVTAQAQERADGASAAAQDRLEDVRATVQARTDQMRDLASQRGDQVRQLATEKTDQVRQLAAERGDQAKQSAAERSTQAGARLTELAGNLRERTQTLGDDSPAAPVAPVAAKVADALEHTGGYLQQNAPDDWVADLKRIIAGKPLESVLVAAILGFIFSRAFGGGSDRSDNKGKIEV